MNCYQQQNTYLLYYKTPSRVSFDFACSTFSKRLEARDVASKSNGSTHQITNTKLSRTSARGAGRRDDSVRQPLGAGKASKSTAMFVNVIRKRVFQERKNNNVIVRHAVYLNPAFFVRGLRLHPVHENGFRLVRFAPSQR